MRKSKLKPTQIKRNHLYSLQKTDDSVFPLMKINELFKFNVSDLKQKCVT